jgi:hypothetical protein
MAECRNSHEAVSKIFSRKERRESKERDDFKLATVLRVPFSLCPACGGMKLFHS